MNRILHAAALALLAVGSMTRADEEQPQVIGDKAYVSGFGTFAFRAILDEKAITPADSLGSAWAHDGKAIYILLGPESINRYLDRALLQVYHNGASLLVASDQPALLEPLSVRILDETVYATNEEDCYRGYPQYPFVRRFRYFLSPEDGSPRRIFQPFEDRGENAVATMRTAALRLGRPLYEGVQLEGLAGFPAESRLTNRECDRQRDLFAVGGNFGKGRVLVLADHSVFIDSMTAPRRVANANSRFAKGVVEWLQGPDNKSVCLFVEDGNVKQKFALPTVDMPTDWLDLILKGLLIFEKNGDKILSQLDKSGPMNQAILSKFPVREVRRALLIGLAFACMLAAFYRLTKSRATPDPARTLVTADLAVLIPHSPVLRQRFEAQVDADNAYDTARQLVRDMFGGLGAEPDASGNPPKLAVVPDRGSDDLHKRVTRLWIIGYGAMPVAVKPADLPKLAEQIDKVLAAADDGWWKFESVQQAPTQHVNTGSAPRGP